MKVRLLGTSAGGGFPQWNCACNGCRTSRATPALARPRTQSSAAVSADGRRWYLLNVSPDIRFQLEAFPPLLTPAGRVRGTAVDGALLTNADLDHTLGLLLLREGERLSITCSPHVRQSLEAGLSLPSLLERYCGADWHPPSEAPAPLLARSGEPSGLRCAAFPVPGKPPRYLEGSASAHPLDNLGYRLIDERTGGRLVFIPDCAAIDARVEAELSSADLLLFDGTFWSEGELQALGGRPAAAMAHLPVSGETGSLARLAKLAAHRRIYVHVNNTNPMLCLDSPERAQVAAAGIEVGEDGQELEL